MKKLASLLLAMMIFTSAVACKKSEETKKIKKKKADEDIEDIEDDDEDEDEDDDDEDDDEDETEKTKKTKKTKQTTEEDDDDEDDEDETEKTKKTKKTSATEDDDDDDEIEPVETDDTTNDTKNNSGRTLEDAISPDELKMMNDQAQKTYVQNDSSMKDLKIEVKGNELIYTYYFNQEFDDATAQQMQKAIDTDANKQMIKNLKGSIEAQYNVSGITITYVYCDKNGKEVAKISA